jgi:hypothetical protein
MVKMWKLLAYEKRNCVSVDFHIVHGCFSNQILPLNLIKSASYASQMPPEKKSLPSEHGFCGGSKPASNNASHLRQITDPDWIPLPAQVHKLLLLRGYSPKTLHFSQLV